jgi:hypothetical protein
MKKGIRVGLALANPLRLIIAAISSLLVCFGLCCLAADQQTNLVAARDGTEGKAVVIVSRDNVLIFYQQDGKPVGVDPLAKGTELTVDSAEDGRLFVHYEDKPGYIKKSDVRPKEGSVRAEQLLRASAESTPSTTNQTAESVASPTPAPAKPLPTTITVDNIIYSNVTWRTVTPATVSIFHATGVASIPLEKLPPELQERFGYDPQKAADYRAQELAAAEQAKAQSQPEQARRPGAGGQQQGGQSRRRQRTQQSQGTGSSATQ